MSKIYHNSTDVALDCTKSEPRRSSDWFHCLALGMTNASLRTLVLDALTRSSSFSRRIRRVQPTALGVEH